MRYLLFIIAGVFANSMAYAQSYLALSRHVTTQTFEAAAAAKQAQLAADTGEGGGSNAFARWVGWADNHRSMVPVGEDIFGPMSMETSYFLSHPGYYCAASSPFPPTWKCMGPYNNYYGPSVVEHSGRVDLIWANPNNIRHIRATANTGGLWESRNMGETWRCITDGVSYGALDVRIPGTMAIAAMAVNPLDTNVIFLQLHMPATAEKGEDYGMGIVFSTNGGVSWSLDTFSGQY